MQTIMLWTWGVFSITSTRYGRRDAELFRRRAAVDEHAGLEGRVEPGTGDHTRTRAGIAALHRLDLATDVVGREDALADEDLAKRDLHRLIVGERTFVGGDHAVVGVSVRVSVRMRVIMRMAVRIAQASLRQAGFEPVV